jgi:mono/diheme cytochrome c family protein
MNFRLLTMIAVAVVLLMTACNNSSNSPKTNGNKEPSPAAAVDEFAATRAIFEKNCVKCHQKTGEGGPVKLEDGTKLKVPNFHEGHALRHPNSDFVKQISKGGDGMPAFKDKLSPQEIDDLVRFIRHEFQGGAAPPPEPMMSPMKGMNMNMK